MPPLQELLPSLLFAGALAVPETVRRELLPSGVNAGDELTPGEVVDPRLTAPLRALAKSGVLSQTGLVQHASMAGLEAYFLPADTMRALRSVPTQR